ncbi:MAG: AlpA family phage regulatory protein [Comamonadaceae bacterium]|nr:AlpA family phage regulatory protein [Comamonadaceae bacterium]
MRMAILRMKGVLAETGVNSHATIYGDVHDGTFTVPVKISERAVGWPDTEVKSIIAARIAGKTDDQIRELVVKLHQARMAGTNETFRTDWFDRSAQLKKQAAQRRKRTTLATV